MELFSIKLNYQSESLLLHFVYYKILLYIHNLKKKISLLLENILQTDLH